LFIFFENPIFFYSNVDDITNIALNEVIDSTGCVARDSIQNIGSDILFLSKEGVRSLGRTVLQDNMPLTSVSSAIREDIVQAVQAETANLIRSAYNERNGFYVVTFPSTSTTFVLDVRMYSQGIVRSTVWDMGAKEFLTTRDGNLLIGLSAGFIGSYGSYLDFDQTYLLKYRSGWIDPGAGTELIWKKMRCYLGAEFDASVIGTWGYDYGSAESYETKDIQGGDNAEWGVSEWGEDEWGSQISGSTLDFQMTRTGELVRIGIQAVINGGNLAFNKIELYFKVGNKL